MKTRVLVHAIATIAITATVFAAVDGFSLKRTPKEGEKATFKMEGSFDFGGTPATMNSVNTETVIKVESDGTYTVQVGSSEAKVSVAGQEMSVPRPIAYYVYKAGGEVAEIRGDDSSPAAYRMANMTAFFEPEKDVKVGDTWTKVTKGDKEKGSVNSKAEYKVVAEEKIGNWETVLVEAKLEETDTDSPGSVVSKYWIAKDGQGLIKSVSKWNNIQVPGSPAPISGEMKMTRVP